MNLMDEEKEVVDDKLHVTLGPSEYGIALSYAFCVIRAAHPILVAAIERGGVKFPEIERYLESLTELADLCHCPGIPCDAFLDEVSDWEEE